MKLKTILLISILLILPFNAFAFDHSHKAFTNILQQHVKILNNGLESKVDYAALKKSPLMLNNYLKTLSDVKKDHFSTWPEEKRLAFLINAYNAFTIELILKNYPVKSIRKIGSIGSSPWKIKFIKLLGETISLDEIEHGMVREKGIYDEPRIHFALVCASTGCPALQNKAFTYDKLETMLEKGLVNFLSDKTRNRFNQKKNRFEISKIFKWYGGDFNPTYGSVKGLLTKYKRVLIVNKNDLGAAAKATKIKYLNYDWNLNKLSH